MLSQLKTVIMATEINLPVVREWEKFGYIPKEGWKMLAKNGYIGISKRTPDGIFRFIEVCKSLLKYDSIGLVSSYAINEITYSALISILPQDSVILEEIREGKRNVALGITEEIEGSNILANQNNAVFDENTDTYIINGKKVLVSNAYVADSIIVVAKTNDSNMAWQNLSLFLVDKSTPGVVVSENTTDFLKLMSVSQITFDDCVVRSEQIIGKKNRAFTYLVEALQFERLLLAVMSLEISIYSLNKTIPYIKNRTVFEKPLMDYQLIRVNLTNFHTRIEVLKNYLSVAIQHFAEGKPNKSEVVISKTMATELVKELSIYLSQLHGGKGYLRESWVSTLFNDIRWMSVAGGCNEVLTDVLSKDIFNIYREGNQ